MDDTSRRDFLRGGWKLGGALLIGAAAYTGYEALRPLASGAGGAKITVGTTSSFADGHEHVRARRTDVRRQRATTTSSRCRRSAPISAATSRTARARAASSARVTARSTTSRASTSPGPAPRGMDRYEVKLVGDNVVVDTERPESRPASRSQELPDPAQGARAASARPDVPRERPQPPPFEPRWLERSLNRYLAWGLVFMVLLLAGFVTYRVREPGLRKDAKRAQTTSYTAIGQPALRRQLRAMSWEGRDRRRKRTDPELEAVLEEHDERPDLRARFGRRVGNRDARVEPRLRRHVHRRTGTPGRHVSALTRTERTERARVAPRRESEAVAQTRLVLATGCQKRALITSGTHDGASRFGARSSILSVLPTRADHGVHGERPSWPVRPRVTRRRRARRSHGGEMRC